MCIDRSSYYSPYKLSHKLEKRLWYNKRNDVYKMCIDRSSYYSPYRHPLNSKKGSGIMRGTMYTKCVLTVPLTIVHTDIP